MADYTRRRFLGQLGLLAGSLLAPAAAFGRSAARRRPNVLLIFTDDQGSIDLNCYGATDLYTPNLWGHHESRDTILNSV